MWSHTSYKRKYFLRERYIYTNMFMSYRDVPMYSLPIVVCVLPGSRVGRLKERYTNEGPLQIQRTAMFGNWGFKSKTHTRTSVLGGGGLTSECMCWTYTLSVEFECTVPVLKTKMGGEVRVVSLTLDVGGSKNSSFDRVKNWGEKESMWCRLSNFLRQPKWES